VVSIWHLYAHLVGGGGDSFAYRGFGGGRTIGSGTATLQLTAVRTNVLGKLSKDPPHGGHAAGVLSYVVGSRFAELSLIESSCRRTRVHLNAYSDFVAQ